MWRPATRQITGTNDVPLGTRRRFGAQPADDNNGSTPRLAQPSPSAYPKAYEQESPGKRGRDETPVGDPQVDANAPRKRRSRWGEAKTEIPGLPTAISAAGVSQRQLDNYAIHLRLEEINRKLRLNDFIPPERERSPSPAPTYDSHGRRTNTREVRYRKKLEDERMRLVDRAMKNDPNFRPPVEYQQQKRSQRPSDKVYIPVKEFPEINFFGLLVGPRGNSLKKMERESGAKISIRGKGSVKEGKARPEQFADDAEEDLHCLIMADTQDKVTACVKLINRVIETAASTPEGQNDHKRNQLRELAALNGTLRDDENQICQNCGGVGHRKYDCPEQRNYTANIICRVCGSAGHMARDCTVNRDPAAMNQQGAPGGMSGPGFDSEYAKLMAELGEGPAPPQGANPQDAVNPSWQAPPPNNEYVAGASTIPPWRRPEAWISNSQPPPQNQGYYPPQGGYGGAWAGFQQQQGYPPQQQDYSSNYAAYGY
ncbi:splicing factor SF1 [Cylindrobasidium torrendii FP15055 ss-10]|uniref:Branchpoint-bridging protein n=1 Tax=Cylindrobasidium torrendii FP15055 ss-10 TaxID=1314674 RepID=A0A0D7B2Z9_9AGAR|nr:splicing factor SF1 [Cylindrobasidium torrendii FP15055 ss-10]